MSKRGRTPGPTPYQKRSRGTPGFNFSVRSTTPATWSSGSVPYRLSTGVSAGRRRQNLRTGGFTGIEKKFYDVALVQTALTSPTDATGGEVNPSGSVGLNTVAQGDGESNRDGRKMFMQSIHLNGVIEQPAQTNQTAADTSPDVFIALVLDTQANSAFANSEDVYKNQAGNAALAASPYRNLEYVSRFRVLAWKRMRLRQPTVVYDGTNVEQGGTKTPFSFNVNLKGMPVTFKGTTADIANITDNALNLIAYTNDTSTAPTISYNSRLRFTG